MSFQVEVALKLFDVIVLDSNTRLFLWCISLKFHNLSLVKWQESNSRLKVKNSRVL